MSSNAEGSRPTSTVGRRLLMHGGVYTAARLANQGLVFLLLPLYARKVGSEGLGVIEVTNATRNVLGILFLQGLGVAWFRLGLTHKDPAERRIFESSIVWYLLLSSVPLLGLLVWLGDDLSRWLTPGVPFHPLGLITACTAAMLALPVVLERHLQGQQKAAQLALFSVARTLVTLVTIVWMVAVLERGATGKVQAEALVAALTLVVSLIWLRPAPLSRARPAQLRTALAYGWAQVPQNLAGIVNEMIDRVIISASLGLAAVGVYSVGYRIASVTMLLMVSVTQAFAPLFAESMHDAAEKRDAGDAAGADQIRRNVARAGLGMFVLACVLAQGVSASGREVIMLVAPAQASGAWPVLAPVSLGVVLWCCHAIFVQSVFFDIASARWVSAIGIVGAASNVLGNMLLVPRIGIMGAAWATLLSNGLYALMSWRVGMRCTPVPYAWGKWLRVLLWTAAAIAAFHVCDGWAKAPWPRVALKAGALAVSLVVTARLAGLSLGSLRTLRRQFAA